MLQGNPNVTSLVFYKSAIVILIYISMKRVMLLVILFHGDTFKHSCKLTILFYYLTLYTFLRGHLRGTFYVIKSYLLMESTITACLISVVSVESKTRQAALRSLGLFVSLCLPL